MVNPFTSPPGSLGIKYTNATYHKLLPLFNSSHKMLLHSHTSITLGLSDFLTTKPRPPPLLRFLSSPNQVHSVFTSSASITSLLFLSHDSTTPHNTSFKLTTACKKSLLFTTSSKCMFITPSLVCVPVLLGRGQEDCEYLHWLTGTGMAW